MARSCLLRAPQRLEIVVSHHVVRQPRLDADDHVAMARNRPAHQGDIGAVEVHQLPVGHDAGSRDIDEHAPQVRRGLGDGYRFIDAVGALRSRIDEGGHAVLETQLRAALAAGGMGVDVDQTGDHDLAARIDDFRGAFRRNVGFQRGNPAAGNGHVADRVDPERGVDDAPALDDQIVGRRKRVRNVSDSSRACGGCAKKLAPIHHRRSPPD
jgi:hypothetical protein